MLEDLVKTLEVNNYGVRAYEQFAQLCYKSVVEQPDMAIFFLTLSVMAERFVNQYDESPLTITVADAQKNKILRLIEKMEKTLNESSAQQVRLLNAVARDILYA